MTPRLAAVRLADAAEVALMAYTARDLRDSPPMARLARALATYRKTVKVEIRRATLAAGSEEKG